MFRHSLAHAEGRWRRWLFSVWIGLTVLAAVYMVIAGPLTDYFHEEMWIVGVIVPPLMILLLGFGLGWLVWVVTASRGPRPEQRNSARHR